MPYQLLRPEPNELKLFFRMEGEAAERHGVIGYLRADFGRTGNEFWSTWFDKQPHLKTPGFKKEFDDVINSLRDDGQAPPFASRRNMEALCATPLDDGPTTSSGYKVQTENYSYYFRCKPSPGDYDMYCFATIRERRRADADEATAYHGNVRLQCRTRHR